MSNVPESVCVANWARQTSEGDKTNLENLAGYLRGLLVRRFIQFGLTAEESQELAQECLIDVLQNLSKFDSERSALGTWVSGFARTTIRSWRRREYSRRTAEIGFEVVPEVPVEDGCMLEIENSVGNSLRKLHVVDQELLFMRFNLGLSFDEIADRTDMTSVNARKRLSRAVERLRRDPEIRAVVGLGA
ncbi:MAG: sigma-70 family RNA polymerase sigma factor [Chthonomonas sp.]|nr:sigma-70 family RNA polymerase sigma factor [Chthonomonas sp.]